MTKHTPGPWDWNGKWRVVSGLNTPQLAVVCDTATNVQSRTEENKANARLIAAAPDLLAACEAAFTLMPTGEYTEAQEAGQEVLRIRRQLRAAIAIAKAQ